jgi:hypothetical protein
MHKAKQINALQRGHFDAEVSCDYDIAKHAAVIDIACNHDGKTVCVGGGVGVGNPLLASARLQPLNSSGPRRVYCGRTGHTVGR